MPDIRPATVTSADPVLVQRDGTTSPVPAVLTDAPVEVSDRALTINVDNVVYILNKITGGVGGGGGDSWEIGDIRMWKRPLVEIPEDWQLCDGTNGTIDLRDKFIVGAGGVHDIGDTGGSDSITLTEAQIPGHTHTGPSHVHSGPSHTHSGPSHDHSFSDTTSSDSHTHSFSDTTSSDSHSHTMNAAFNPNSSNPMERIDAGSTPGSGNGTYSSMDSDAHTHSVSGTTGSDLHTHTVSGTTGSGGTGNTGSGGTGDTGSSGTGATGSTGGGTSFDNRPAFYALAFIEKVA